jgi:uncharacterized oxidoreductase
MPTVAADALTAFARRAFGAAGVPADEAAVVAASLVDANLCGHDSHGVLRVPQYVGFIRDGTFKPGAPFTVLNETPAVLAADGGWGLGQVQAHRLLRQLLPKAQSLGVAAGTLRNCGHIGRLGEYAEVAAAGRLAFFACVNSHGGGRRVVPPGGSAGRLSTNPICFGVPTPGHPVVLDFGTSVVAEGKVRVCYQQGQPVPDGWLVDHAGRPTTDPRVLYAEPRGGILPFGGSQAYKGFGLGLVVDLLAGGLSGGRCSNPDLPMAAAGNSVVFALFDPAAFGGTEHLLREAEGLTAAVRGCPPIDAMKPITLPGDPERRCKAERQRTGIPIQDGTWRLLAQSSHELGVDLPAVG